MWFYIICAIAFAIWVIVLRSEGAEQGESKSGGNEGARGAGSTLQPRFSDIIHGETKRLSPWQTFKGQDPKFASDIETLLSYRNMEECTQRDINELVATFNVLSEEVGCDVSELKKRFFEHLVKRYLLQPEKLEDGEVLIDEEIILKDARELDRQIENTMGYIFKEWNKEYLANYKEQKRKEEDPVETEVRDIAKSEMNKAVQAVLAKHPDLANDRIMGLFQLEAWVGPKVFDLELQLSKFAPHLDLGRIVKEEKEKAINRALNHHSKR